MRLCEDFDNVFPHGEERPFLWPEPPYLLLLPAAFGPSGALRRSRYLKQNKAWGCKNKVVACKL